MPRKKKEPETDPVMGSVVTLGPGNESISTGSVIPQTKEEFFKQVEQEWRDKWRHVRKVWGVAKLLPLGWDSYRGMFTEEEAHKFAKERSALGPYLVRITCDGHTVAMYANGKEIKQK